MDRRTSIACMLALSQLLVLAALPSPTAAEDNVVTGTHVVSLEETWGNITIAGTGRLVVPAGTVLNAVAIVGEPGSVLEVTGGRVVMANPAAGGDVGIRGLFLHINVTGGSSLVLTGAPASADVSGPGPHDAQIPHSQGGDAVLDVTASGGIRLENCSISLRGGKGFDLPPSDATTTHAWTSGALSGWCAAGGNATFSLLTTGTAAVRIANLDLDLVGGDGGRASDGGDCSVATGAFGGGYSDGGEVGGSVGAGGNATLSVESPSVSIATADVDCTGGRGGAAGSGGSTWNPSNGGGGGGGYSGGNGGGSNQAGASGGAVGGRVGSGGDAVATFLGGSVDAAKLLLLCTGGAGGRAGDGGSSHSTGDGAGGGGYGGGGGGGYTHVGGKGLAKEGAGAGGRASVDVTGTLLDLDGCDIWGVGGAGGRAGDGGDSAYGGGGGGGYGGGGGGGAYVGGDGGSGEARDLVGSGGPAAIAIAGSRVEVNGSRLFGRGGAGGQAGNGGDATDAGAGFAGGGGGGGYAGGGGAGGNSQPGMSASAGGDGTVTGPVGSGGDATVGLAGTGLAMVGATVDLAGGKGGDAGTGGAGLLGSNGGGGGGGGYGGAGGASNTLNNVGGRCFITGTMGRGGNATVKWSTHPPSISRTCGFTAASGEAGIGTASPGGGGTHGGRGAGANTVAGRVDSPIPTSVALPLSPANGSFVRTGEALPALTWLDLHSSTTNGDVVDYLVELDDATDFLSPLASQVTTSVSYAYGTLLPIGTYHWRVMARYAVPTGTSAGWSETWSISVDENIKPTSKVDSLPQYTTTRVLAVGATAEDLESGILEVELWYSRDGGPWTLYGTDAAPPMSWEFDTSTTGGDGGYGFYSRAWDNSHNHEDAPAANDTSTLVDTTAPASSLDPLAAFTTVAAFAVLANASDLNGVSGVEVWYRKDAGPWTLCGEVAAPPYTLTVDTSSTGGDGTYELYSRARDVAGNLEDAPPTNDTWTVVDTTAPVSRVDALPAYVTDGTVVIGVTASDRNGITRVELWSSRDAGAWSKFPNEAPPDMQWTLDLETVGGDGTYRFYTRAWDAAGNREDAPAEADTWTTLDTTAPSSDVDVLPSYTKNATVDIAASAFDAGGLASVELWYSWAGGPWTMYCATASMPPRFAFDTSGTGGDGDYRFYSRGRDLAGHYEDAPADGDARTTVDTLPPASSTVPLQERMIRATFEVRANASDANGVAKVELWYQRDGGTWTMYGASPTLPAVWSFDTSKTGGDGRYLFYTRAWDVADNREEAPALNDTWTYVDTVGPTITVAAPLNGSTVRSSSLAVSATAADASGLAGIEVSIDEGEFIALDEAGAHTFRGVGDGWHRVTVRAVDNFGNARETTVQVRISTPTSGVGTTVYIAIAIILVLVVVVLAILASRRRRAPG